MSLMKRNRQSSHEPIVSSPFLLDIYIFDILFNRANFMSAFCEAQANAWVVLDGTSFKSSEVRPIGFSNKVFLQLLLSTHRFT